MMFCLNITVTPNAKITTNLCNNCYRKIISFCKFKTLSLKNDEYLKSLYPAITLVDEEVSVYADENGMKHDNSLDPNECGPNVFEDSFIVVKEEVIVKYEDSEDIESGEELQSLKEENKFGEFKEEIKRNAPEPKTSKLPKQVKPSKVAKVKQEHKICEQCGKSVLHLKQHSLKHRPPSQRPMLQCKACPKMFATHRGRLEHHKIKHLGYKYECDICHKRVACASGLSAHKLRVHFPDAQRFGCVLCERRFESQSTLNLHMTVHTNVRAFECDICHRKFRIKDRMTRHIRRVHQKERSHQCHFCPKRFFEKFFLDAHIRKHTKERPYECGECGKSFATKDSLKQHQALHCDEKALHCKLCDKSFASTTTLKQHQIAHSDIKPFHCQGCDKSFASTTTLKQHQIIHSDVKPFHCQVCDKSFKRLGNLQMHMITHTKEKKHPCQFCGVSFGRSDLRNRHERNVHQKKLVS